MEIKLFLNQRCFKCLLIKQWLKYHPDFNRFVKYDPPTTTVPRVPYLLVNGEAFYKVNEILRQLDQLTGNN